MAIGGGPSVERTSGWQRLKTTLASILVFIAIHAVVHFMPMSMAVAVPIDIVFGLLILLAAGRQFYLWIARLRLGERAGSL